MQPLGEVLAVVFAALVALVPVLYPKHSIYRRKGLKAIDSLKSLNDDELLGEEVIIEDINHSDLSIGYLDRDDRGFRALEIAIDRHTEIRAPYQSIVLLHKQGSALTFNSEGPTRSEKCKLVIFDTDGEDHVVLEHPFNVERILELKDVENWIENIARERSQHWTTFLVLIWMSLAIWTTIF